MSDLVQRVLSMMAASRMTQTDLARATGYAQSRVNDFLSGKTADPKVSFVMAMADALGVSVDELVGHATRDSVATTPDEAALLADYRALDAASKAVVCSMVAGVASDARAKMPAPRSASSEVA